MLRHGWTWLYMARHGHKYLEMTGNALKCLEMTGNAFKQQATAGTCCEWLNMAVYYMKCPKEAEFGRNWM